MSIDTGDEALLNDWLFDWEEHYGQGEDLPPEKFCADRLDLVEELRRRIGLLKAFETTPADVEGSRTNGRISASCLARFFDLKLHAEGGLGEVYEARDNEFSRNVALKFLKASNSQQLEARDRFRAEAEITGRLEHPGIVPIYGMGEDNDGHPCYAMRFVRGLPLNEAIRQFHEADAPALARSERDATLGELLDRIKGKPLAEVDGTDLRDRVFRELLQRFKGVCETVAYAHSKHVLHRDLKPANVMLGKFGETLVVDWGLARTFETASETSDAVSDEAERTMPIDLTPSNLTPTVGPKGTPAYMSPEQASARRDLGPASDVYSLGATLYCLLTGHAPFRGRMLDVVEQVRDGAFPPPRSSNPGIPRPLEEICLKAMARIPTNRYGSAEELADDIDNWLADRPVSAWCEPFSLRARRWAKRNQTAVTGASGAILAGVIGLAIVVAEKSRANANLRDANVKVSQALIEMNKAKQATEEALAKSKESLSQAEAVSNFLVEAFRSPDPLLDGKKILVVDLLDRAAEKLDTEFIVTAATRGAMLNALGQTYHGLSLYDKAVSTDSKALAVLEAALGFDHADTLSSRNNLAEAYLAIGRTAEAVQMLEETLKQGESTLGRDDPLTLLFRNTLATAYYATGRTTESIRLCEETLKLSESKLGPDHALTLSSRNNLAEAYLAIGRTAEAVQMLEETLKLRVSKLGPDHADTLLSQANLAAAYYTTGRMNEAIRMNEETLKLRVSKLGPDHAETLTSRNNLAAAYHAAGRMNEAIRTHEETLKLRESKLGPDHRLTLQSRNNLAVSYLAAGRTTEAIRMNEETLKLRVSKLGPDHADTLLSRANLATSYEALGRWAEAEPLERDMLGRRSKSDKPDSPVLAGDLARLGRNLLNQAKWSDAESVLRECLAVRAKVVPDDWSRFNTMSMLGGALLGQGRYAEAEPLIVPGYEGMSVRKAKIPAVGKPRLTEAAERVVRLYQAWGKPEKAQEWRQKIGTTPEAAVNPATR